MLEEGERQIKIALNRIKFQEVVVEKVEEDAISALPDCLLQEILSRLPSIKDAIKTGTLSKRWKHLWTSIPTLILSHLDYPLKSTFNLLVDKTLTQCRQLKLKKFELHTIYDIQFESLYNNWIRYAIQCNVKEFKLGFQGWEPKFLFDQPFFFINSCFTDLRLSCCILNPSGVISWKNLRSLHLSYVNLDDGLFVNIVSGSPLLETSVFKHCNGHRKRRLNITSNEINAPNISSLTQCPQLKLKKFEVHSSFDIQFQSRLSNWIRYAIIRCNVEVLKLDLCKTEWGDDFMLDQILFTSSCLTELRLYGCMINPIVAVSWKNLKSLCIIIRNLDEDLIENILSGSPVLESLVLHSCCGYKRLDITSKRVKNLVLSGFKFNIIEMNAPNILSLTITGELLLSRFLSVNVSSLVKANLNWICTNGMNGFTMPNEAEQVPFKEFILKPGHVKELEIGFDCSKVISCLQAKGFVVPANVKLTGIE